MKNGCCASRVWRPVFHSTFCIRHSPFP